MPSSPHTATVKAAARLRSLGFGICRILAKEKTPNYKGWTRASLEDGDFEQSAARTLASSAVPSAATSSSWTPTGPMSERRPSSVCHVP